MPPAIAGVVLAAALAGGGAFLAGASLTIAIGLFVANIALGLLSYLLAPKPNIPNFASFSAQAQDRLQQIRQPISPRRLIYGEVRVSGPLTFIETTDDNKYLHLIITLGDGPIQAINTIWLDEEPIHNEALDADGNVTTGKYSGKVRIKKHLGALDQVADGDLVAEIARYTTARRGQGIAYIYVRLEYNKDLFVAQIPNHSAFTKGRLVYDPRDATTAWNPNVVLGTRDYVTRTRLLGGLGATTDELNDTINNASANICDEIVDTKNVTISVTAFDASVDTISLAGELLELQTGDRAELTVDGGTLPAELAASTAYYVILVNEAASLDKDGVTLIPIKVQLATSYDNALLGTAIDFTDAGTGTSTIVKTGEPRYTAHGVITTDRAPFAIMKDFELSMAGRIVNAGGEWRMIAGAYTAPTVHFTLTHARSTIKKRTKHPRRARFNGVHGIFVNPMSRWQPTDYPVVRSTTFKAEDDGEELLRNIDLPLTTRSSMAQRIVWIELKRHRKQTSVDFPAKIYGIMVQAGSTCTLTAANLGFASTIFEVASWSMSVQEQGGAPAMVTDLGLRELSSDVFTFDHLVDEQLLQPPVRITAPDPFNPGPPGAPVVVESTYNTRTAGGVKAKATLTWTASVDALVSTYEAAYKLSSDSVWIDLPATTNTTVDVLDIKPGTYDFRVQSVNVNNVHSSATASVTSGVDILGLAAAPAGLVNLTMEAAGGLAILRWDLPTDLDVLAGGKIIFRHSPATSGGSWAASVTIGNAVDGNVTVALLPLKPGTYLARAQDSSGVLSALPAMAVTKAGTVLLYSTTSTLAEHSGFTGTHASTVADGTNLKLSGLGLFDAIPDLDAVGSLDDYGGLSGDGVYDFATNLDLGTVTRVRLQTDLAVLITNSLDQVDDRTSDIDDWEDFDGTGAGPADAQVWVRETDDDPAGAPSWSTWARLDSAEYNARAFEFQCRLSTTDPAYNILVSEVTVTADEVA